MTSPMQSTFQELFCRKHTCGPRDFEWLLLQASLYQQARRWLKFLCWIETPSINHARDLIREVGKCSSLDEVEDAVFQYQHLLSRDASFLTYRLNLRISCRRLLDICRAIAADDSAGQLELFGPARNIIPLPAAPDRPPQRSIAVDF